MTGVVVSNKMQKTITVLIESKEQHPLYKKVIRRHKKFKAHVENMDLAVGDKVEITETRPISKTVTFQVTKKL